MHRVSHQTANKLLLLCAKCRILTARSPSEFLLFSAQIKAKEKKASIDHLLQLQIHKSKQVYLSISTTVQVIHLICFFLILFFSSDFSLLFLCLMLRAVVVVTKSLFVT